MIYKGDTVRITIPHKYQGQDVQVLVVDGRRMRGKKKRGYKLGTIQLPFQGIGYFTADELDLVAPKGSNGVAQAVPA